MGVQVVRDILPQFIQQLQFLPGRQRPNLWKVSQSHSPTLPQPTFPPSRDCRAGRDRVNFYRKGGDKADFTFLVRDTGPPYADKSYLLATPSQAAVGSTAFFGRFC